MSNHCFLLGAGFTHVVTEGEAFLTDQIMGQPEIKKIVEECDFSRLIDDYNRIDRNSELFITLLDLKIMCANDSEQKEKLNQIKDKIVNKIVSYFDIDRFNRDYLLCDRFIDKIENGTNILTLNYDCVLDRSLWKSERWSFKDGYRVSVFPSAGPENRDGIIALKLHGSCNFRIMSKKQRNQSPFTNQYFNIEITEKIFPGCDSAICSRNMMFNAEPRAIVMSYLKQYSNDLCQIWEAAIEALKNADKLTVIGCALREEDTFLRFAIRYFGRKENADRFQVEIIDKSEDEAKVIKSKVQRIVAYPDKQNFTLYKNFKDYLST